MTMTKLQYFSKDRNEDRRSQPHQPDGQPADSPLDGPQFHRAGRSERMSRRAYVIKREDLLAAAECLREALKVYPGRKTTR